MGAGIESAGDVRRADEVESQQLVERLERRRRRNSGGGRRQLGLERVAGHRRPFEDEPASPRAGRAPRRAPRRRSVGPALLRARRRAPRGRSARRGRSSGRAARGRTDCRHSPRRAPPSAASAAAPTSSRASARVSVPSSERSSTPARWARSSADASRSDSCRGRTATASSTGAAGGRWSRAPSSSTEAGSAQWTSSRISTSGRVARGAPAARGRRGGCGSARAGRAGARPESKPGERREDGRQLRPDLQAELVEALRLEPADVLVECVDEDPEREILLELRRRARQHEVTAFVRASRELREEPRLADPRLSDELDRGRRAFVELRQARSNALSSAVRPTSWCCHPGHRRLLAPDDTSGHAHPRNQGAESGCRTDAGATRERRGSIHRSVTCSTTVTTPRRTA